MQETEPAAAEGGAFAAVDWSLAIGVAALLAAAVAAVAVHALLYRIARRALSGKAAAPEWLSRSRPATRLAVVAVAILAVLPWLALGPAAIESARHAVRLLLIAAAGWTAIVVLRALTEAAMARRRIDIEDNLEARKFRTRMRILRQAATVVIVLVTVASMLVTFPAVRAIGLSLFASAGIAGIVVGFAAQPILANLIAGLQIALTQPIRVDDVVVVEGEFGWIEEITSAYVVIRLWDLRRLIVPLSWFTQHAFENWTRENANIVGSVVWHLDYAAPIDAMREKLAEFLKASPLWDGDSQALQVIDCERDTIKVRALMSAGSSSAAWDLRCEVREKMIAFLKAEHPEALPRTRIEPAGQN